VSSFLLLILCTICLRAAEPARVSASIGEAETFWVGQRIPFYVKLKTGKWFTGTPKFYLPEIPGVLVLKIEERPVLGSETIDETSYTTQQHEFALFVRRTGTIVLPGFDVSFSSAGASFGKSIQHKLKTAELRFQVKMPPGAGTLSNIISTTHLEVNESWEPQPEAAKVGDAFTRTIKLKAPHIPGMAFPPLPVKKSEGLGIYTKKPVVQDQMERGDFIGERIETITYVCEKEGKIELPGLVFSWWDVNNREFHQIKLNPVILEVAANPQFSTAGEQETGAQTQPGPEPFPWWAAGIGLLVVIILVLLIIFRRFLILRFKERQAARRESEAAYFKRFKKACRSGSAADVMQALMTWLDRNNIEGKTARLETFVSQANDPGLAKQVLSLETNLYALKRKGAWNGKTLYRAVKKARHKQQKKKNYRSLSQIKGLPVLNPISD